MRHGDRMRPRQRPPASSPTYDLQSFKGSVVGSTNVAEAGPAGREEITALRSSARNDRAPVRWAGVGGVEEGDEAGGRLSVALPVVGMSRGG